MKINRIKNLLLLLGLISFGFYSQAVQPEKRSNNQSEKINILVLTERGGQHESFTAAALSIPRLQRGISFFEFETPFF